MKMTFNSEIFIYYTSDLLRFVHFRLSFLTCDNTFIVADSMHLLGPNIQGTIGFKAFSTPTLTACKNDHSPRPFLSINAGIDKQL